MDPLLSLLKDKGPLTGKDIVLETGIDSFKAWKLCLQSSALETRIVGKRYLRLDAKVEEYARLSPSIMREFLNYTVVGLNKDHRVIIEAAKRLEQDSLEISSSKIRLARDTVQRLFKVHSELSDLSGKICFIVAGDVVFGMAHREPRPESSTGELVRGSDLDIIAVSEELPEDLLDTLDKLLYKEKYSLLMNPASKEELDYIVKDISTVRKQLYFNDFKKMVASKILNEGLYLDGSEALFSKIKTMVEESGVPEKIVQLQEKAILDRGKAEKTLLAASDGTDYEELMALFYTTEEKEEIF